MRPFPTLARWARQLQLPASRISLFLYDTGDNAKPPVLFLHGLGDEADTWRHVLPLITVTHRGLAPDLPGFGRSEKAKRRHTIPFFVNSMRELLDHLAISRTVLVGHSTGGVIAHAIALEHPERVEKLVLVAGSLVSKENRINPDLLGLLTPILGEWLYNRLRKDPQAAFRTLEPYYNRMDELSQTDRDFLYQRVNERVWSDGQRYGFLSTLRSLAAWVPAQQKKLPERLANWEIPTTVIWGDSDQISSVENARALVDLLPTARLVMVRGAGHNVQQERAEAVAEAVLK